MWVLVLNLNSLKRAFVFLVIIPIFLALCVLFAYLYAYVPFGVLSLSKKLSVRISFFIFYAIFTLLIAFARLEIVVIMPYAIAIVILSILILKRKGYFTNFTKVRVAMAGACLLVFTWLLEVPQKIIVNLLPVKLEIINDDFEYIENPGIDNNLYFKEEKTKKFLNFTYSKINIYACDDFKCKEKNRYACDGFGCKGNKKYVGSYWESWSERSTLMCYMNTAGRCLGTVSKDYDAIEEILKYIKRGKNE